MHCTARTSTTTLDTSTIEHTHSIRSCSTKSAPRGGRAMLNEIVNTLSLQRCASKQAEHIDILFVCNDAVKKYKPYPDVLFNLYLEIDFVEFQCVFI